MADKNSTVIVTGLWETKNGHYRSLSVDERAFTALQACFEQGGKFLIRRRSQDSINKSKNPETAPVAYLEFVPAAEVARFDEQRKARNGL